MHGTIYAAVYELTWIKYMDNFLLIRDNYWHDLVGNFGLFALIWRRRVERGCI